MVEKYRKLNLVVTNVGPLLACAWYEHGYEHGYEEWYQGPYQAGMTSGNTRFYISIRCEVISSMYLTYTNSNTKFIPASFIPGQNQPWTQHQD